MQVIQLKIFWTMARTVKIEYTCDRCGRPPKSGDAHWVDAVFNIIEPPGPTATFFYDETLPRNGVLCSDCSSELVKFLINPTALEAK